LDLETHGNFREADSSKHGFLLAEDEQDNQPAWVTARDIYLGHPLHAELLTAAMCYSGQMKIFSGDEIGGLIRAFLYSGCRSILLYPWALDDQVAKEFTPEFYRHLIQFDSNGIPWIRPAKDVALQKAQINIISQGRQGRMCNREKNWEQINVSWEHPYYWAWILIGDHA
jgi:CHAT domain-containing protein